MNGQFLPRKNPAKTVKGRGFLDRGLMNTKINNKRISELMKHKNIKVVSIDTENMLYICDDGNEYPLMDGLETLSIEELQKHVDSAKQATLDIIEKIENEDG